MSAAKLRRHLPVGRKREAHPAVELLAARHAFEATPRQKREIARRADELASSPVPSVDAVSGPLLDLAVGGWKARAEAASELSDGGAWTPWTVVGSLAARPGDVADDGHDDARLASAVLLAARETLSPHVAGLQEEVRGHLRAAVAHEAAGPRRWDAGIRPLVSEFVRNARAHGHGRRAAALRALMAAVHLKGSAMAAPLAVDPFLLGSAASMLLRPKRAVDEENPSPALRLVRAVAAVNDARAALWDERSAPTRLLGAAAALAAFGRGTVAPPFRRIGADAFQRAHLRAHVPEAFAHFTAAEAAAALEDHAADPRLGADVRRRRLALADALRHHPCATSATCAEALGLEPPDVRKGEPLHSMRVYRAVMDGRRRPVLHEGRNGRPVRCHAIAAEDGAFIGHLAYDALSREFGRALHAIYALDGRRYGYAWAELRPVIRRGEPAQGFRTAPERLPA